MRPLVLYAFALDAVVGDPRGIPHPVRWIGAAIARGEQALRARIRPVPWAERVAGASLAFGIVAVTVAASAAAIAAGRRLDRRLGRAIELAGAASTLAACDLLREAAAVHGALVCGDLDRARTRLARIVGRDTATLDAPAIARAVIETLAESTCDGVVAPLCALALGGVPAAMGFKAISTLDSMIGHREPPYTSFGTVAARLDDAANFVPARLAALAIALAAPCAGGSTASALRAVASDARRHASPNAGYPESAIAGALGVRLGGALSYDGVPAHAPVLNGEGRLPGACDVARAMRLCAAASLAVAILGAAGSRG